MKCVIPQKERIHTDRFVEMADFRYELGYSIPNKSGEIYTIFCKTDFIHNLLKEIRQNLQSEYIIITSESDYGITQELCDSMPANVKRWFAQNVMCYHEKLESIPIGSVDVTWIGEKEFAYDIEWIGGLEDIHQYRKIEETGKSKDFINLVYMNFCVQSNPTIRMPVYEYFRDKDWVTVRQCLVDIGNYPNSLNSTLKEEYYEELYNHKFVVSPLGGGVDCGRVWQAICLGTIPIVFNHRNLDFYKELPILVYDNINEITKNYLEEKWEEMSNKKYDLSKATVSYWKDRIEKEKYAQIK